MREEHTPAPTTEQPGRMTDQQRQQWAETGLFPVERWSSSEGSTPLHCPMPTNEELRTLAMAVPERILASGWYTQTPRFGRQFLYADNFRGIGRQWIADVHPNKRYSGGVAEYLAAMHPRTVLRLLDRIAELERAAQDKEPHHDA